MRLERPARFAPGVAIAVFGVIVRIFVVSSGGFVTVKVPVAASRSGTLSLKVFA
jgi:hypothetical protein